jgi:hypothetical protein
MASQSRVEPVRRVRRAVLNESYLDFQLGRWSGRHHFSKTDAPFGADGFRHLRSCSIHCPAQSACRNSCSNSRKPLNTLRSAFRFGLLDHYLLSISLTATPARFSMVGLLVHCSIVRGSKALHLCEGVHRRASATSVSLFFHAVRLSLPGVLMTHWRKRDVGRVQNQRRPQ